MKKNISNEIIKFKFNLSILLVFTAFHLLMGCGGFNANSPKIIIDSSEENFNQNSILVGTASTELDTNNKLKRVNKIYYSNNLGQSWHELHRSSDYFSTWDVKILKFEDNKLYFSTGIGFGVSSDFGKTWNYFGDDDHESKILSKTTYDAMYFSKNYYIGTSKGILISDQRGNVLAEIKRPDLTTSPSSTVTNVIYTNGKTYASTLYDIVVSDDFGMNWNLVNYKSSPTDYQGNPEIKSHNSKLWINDIGSGIHKSNDNGISWETIKLPDISPFREFVSSLEFGGTKIFGWNYMGFYTSDNEGLSWTWKSIESLTNVKNSQIVDFSFSGNIGLIQTKSPSRLYLTKDRAESWSDITSKLDLNVDDVRKVFVPIQNQ